jgi:hypothetical protein
MPSQSQPLRLPFITIVITLLCVLSVGAQSGRKVRKTTPAPVPAPSPEINTPKPKEQPKPALTVVVGMERSYYFGSTASAGAGGVLLTMVDRLEDHPGVKVAHVGRDMTRSDAVRRARSEKEAYVILLELSFDRGASTSNGDQLRLSYWVYSPGTAKIKTSGQTYPQWYRNRSVILNPRTPNIYGDYQLEAASRDAAERILKAFHLHLPSERRAT